MMAINQSEESAPAYSAVTMKARLGLDATMTVKAPTGIIKQSVPVTPAQFTAQARTIPVLNNANHVAGEAMRIREVNSGIGENKDQTPYISEDVQNKVARQSPGQTKQSIFGR